MINPSPCEGKAPLEFMDARDLLLLPLVMVALFFFYMKSLKALITFLYCSSVAFRSYIYSDN